jgi:acetyl-CoA carboxylase biotin carboxyl carrier protein
VDLKDIKAVIDLMKKNSILEFEMEKEGFKIRLKRGLNGSLASTPSEDFQAMAYSAQPAVPLAASMPVAHAMPAVAVSSDIEIKAPMVGTFYRAPSPESAPYIDVGAELSPESVVCIIEAMKVMNEIKSEVRGVVTQVLAENGKPVEFGQPLFKVRPA